ncbi:Stk1 family PASTA domain-containing Ser/Thr kinase [Terrisporobacter mayombei]|uniref:non-specific serine/threonine protein kinase n=1 Tax=Terrisporobacter mayombei TaxID=1541 RepID=A0ABY9Q1V4_9FIRM|nr:Stk1 family PASTA domain-containing Ser/Thr kinase [Terrisporobacter mayombei]WMT81571.1 Serine/threonine-protein kinase PrkC [Terrisporobacter mayombei]
MGETILGNRYEIIRKIGDGGMAFVYEAKDRLLNRVVAVKVLRPEFVDDEEFLAKFKREAEAVANISHHNIVNVYDVGCDGKVNYIVMEYVDGQNLKEIIKSEGTLDEYTALDITKQIAKALGAAHKKGVIHRDIKPHNILISSEGRNVKVADFGIAKAATNSTMTNIGSIIGSVHYFSPEQAKGKSVKNNADLYSLGIVLYEMLLGKVPFKGDSPISIALQHINEEIDFTLEEKTQIPQSIRTLIKKLTEKSPEDRYQSSEEVIEDIEYIEQNIDLDFIKQYDDFATRRIPPVEVVDESKFKTLGKEQNRDAKDDGSIQPEGEDVNNYERRSKKKKRRGLKGVLIGLLVLAMLGVAGVVTNGFGLLNKNEQVDVIKAPNLLNMSLENANKVINDLGLKLTITEKHDSDIEKNHVISQTPPEGTELEKGDTVTIVISLGPEELSVPNLIGFSLKDAKTILKDKGLELGSVSYGYSEIYKEGTVINQNPVAGVGSVKKGDVVNIVVSKGEKPTEEKPSEEKPSEEKPSEEKPSEKKPSERKTIRRKTIRRKTIRRKTDRRKTITRWK